MNSEVFLTRNPERSVFSRIAIYIKDANATAELKSQIRHERNQLMRLSDEELRDIGLTRNQAEQEASRGFDDVPKHRLNRLCP